MLPLLIASVVSQSGFQWEIEIKDMRTDEVTTYKTREAHKNLGLAEGLTCYFHLEDLQAAGPYSFQDGGLVCVQEANGEKLTRVSTSAACILKPSEPLMNRPGLGKLTFIAFRKSGHLMYEIQFKCDPNSLK